MRPCVDQRTLAEILAEIESGHDPFAFGVGDPNVNLALVQMRGMQNIKGEHLVRPDGTVSLGMYGSAYVAGMTLGQVKAVLENCDLVYVLSQGRIIASGWRTR